MPNRKTPTLLLDIKLNISHDNTLPNYYSHMACTIFALKWTESLKKMVPKPPVETREVSDLSLQVFTSSPQ